MPAAVEMIKDGYTVFTEISPHPIMTGHLQKILTSRKAEGLTLPTLRRKEDENRAIFAVMARIFTEGLAWDDKKMYPQTALAVELPRYPFSRESFWLEDPETNRKRIGTRPHPHLESCSDGAQEKELHIWNIELDHRSHPYILDHRVQGPLVYPGAGHVDLALAAARNTFGERFNYLEDINFFNPLFLAEEGEPYKIHLEISSDDGRYVIASQTEPGAEFKVHSNGKINVLDSPEDLKEVAISDIQDRMIQTVDMAPLFSELKEGGLDLGPTFQGIKTLFQGEGESLGRLEVHSSLLHDFQQHCLHPSLLDASFQAAFGITAGQEKIGVFIPIHIGRIIFNAPPKEAVLYAHAIAREKRDQTILADISVYNPDGTPILKVEGFKSQYLKGSKGELAGQLPRFYYRDNWLRREHTSLLRNRDSRELLNDPEELQIKLDKKVEELNEELARNMPREDAESVLDILTWGYILDALKEWKLTEEETLDPENLISRLGIEERHRQLFNMMLEILKEGEFLTSDENIYSWTEKRTQGETADLYSQYYEEFPLLHREFRLLNRCGNQLVPVLKGEMDPVQLIFPPDDFEGTVDYYVNAYSFKKYNDMMALAIAGLIEKHPEKKTLRILEVGAGTGGVTQAILPVLPADRTEYYFTDLSPLFLAQAQGRFSAYPFVQYQVVDIEKDCESQGLEPHSFDLIIASDVLHATRDLRETLNHVKALLGQGGILALLEVTNNPPYLDLIFGMTEGWWMFEDTELRPFHCSLSHSRWMSLLDEQGFRNITGATDSPEGSSRKGQSVFLARMDEFSQDSDTDSGEPEGAEDSDSDVDSETESSPRGILLLGTEQQRRKFNWLKAEDEKAEKLVIPEQGLEELKQNETSVHLDPENETQWEELFKSLPVIPERIIDLRAFFLPSPEQGYREYLEAQTAYFYSLSILRKTIMEIPDLEEKDIPRFSFITQNSAVPTREEEPALNGAPLIGAARVFMNEPPLFPSQLIDISGQPCREEQQAIIREIFSEEGPLREEEVILRGSLRYIRKLDHLDPRVLEREQKSIAEPHKEKFMLKTREAGPLENLGFHKEPESQAVPGTLAADVHYAPLNFRDFLIAIGNLNNKAIEGGLYSNNFGLEFGGILREDHPDNPQLKKGHPVIGLARSSLSSRVHVLPEFTAPLPEHMTLEQGSALPVVYLTAWYALVYLGRIEEGDRVLIHAATGGVGQAALQICRFFGAKIFATASPPKQDFLREQGIKNIYNSRTLEFHEQIMEDTEGQGVDIVLNSLAGASITQSIKTLSPGGRFLEIGKRDIYENKRIGLEPFGQNLSYNAVDIDRLLVQKPRLMARNFRDVMEFISENKISPLPSQTFSADDIQKAFHNLSRSRHYGKIIIDLTGPVTVKPPLKLKLPRNSSYIVTGGNSGFGLECALLLSQAGAGKIYTVSRSGLKRETDKRRYESLVKDGHPLEPLECDISNEDAVKELIEKINDSGIPLRGVIHSAMVLEDALFKDLKKEHWEKVMAPKILGALYLDRYCGDELDFFVSFSSIASAYGSGGQANYAAANSFLDQFSLWRRSKGRKASTINWGVIGDTGFVHRTDKIKTFLSGQGWFPIPLIQTLEALEAVLIEQPANRGVIKVNWQEVALTFPHNLKSVRFAHLHKEQQGGAGAGGDDQFYEQLKNLDSKERLPLMLDGLKELCAKVFGMEKTKVDTETPLNQMGMDSLMANQIRSWITSTLRIDFSMMQIMQGPSLQQLAEAVLSQFGTMASSAAADSGSPWFILKNPRPQAKRRLFCFSFLGGGASSYSEWLDRFGPDIEVYAVQLPGREERLSEPAMDNGEELFKALSRELKAFDDKPICFYGHSFGGNIAFSLAAYMKGVEDREVEHLFLASCVPPGEENPLSLKFETEKNRDKEITPDMMKALLRTLGTDENFLNDEQGFTQAFPTLKGDLAISQERDLLKDLTLPVPLTALAAVNDQIYPPDLIRRWEKNTSSEFSFVEIEGSHFFLTEETGRNQAISEIEEKLSE